MTLRPYQQLALNAITSDINLSGASLVVMPTASGKSHVIAEAAMLMSPVLILQPSVELVAQNMNKLLAIVDKNDIGVYSASFGEKTIKKFTFATIQSVYKKPELFQHIKLVIIDEAHLVNIKELETTYSKFLSQLSSPKLLGFTATPYRLVTGYRRTLQGDLIQGTMLKLINRMRHKSQGEMFWKRIIYSISHAELVKDGYLSPIEYIHEPLLPYEDIPINKSYSDYNLEAYEKAIVGREAIILSTIAEAQKRFNSVLVFCSTTEQAGKLSSVIVGSAVVFGDTPKKERAQTIEDFKSGKVKTVFNVGTLTVGFDHPSLDCIVLLRPTRSLPLYNQIMGRLTRVAPGKTRGTVIDLTGTCKNLGRIETFQIYRDWKGLWDLKTEKHESWNGRILFERQI